MEPEKKDTGNDEVVVNYDDMSIEELDKVFASTGGVMPEDEPEPAPEPEAVAEPEPEADTEPRAADPTDVSEPQEATPEDTAQEEGAPPAEPDIPDDNALQMQEIQLQLERVRQEREQFESIAGRNTGEIGFLKKELERLRAAPAPQPTQDPLDYQPAETPPVQPQPARAPSQLEGQVAELQDDSKASAVQRVYSEFLTQISTDLTAQGVNQEKVETEQISIMEQITPTLKQRFEPFGDLSTLNTKATEKVTRMVLQGAYTDIKLAKVAALRKTVSERTATQIAKTRIAKQAASPSASGSRGVKEAPPKSDKDLTWEEADAALTAEHGERRHQRPRL